MARGSAEPDAEGPKSPTVTVAARDGGQAESAAILAGHLGLAVAGDTATSADLELCLTAGRLELRSPSGRHGPVCADFTAPGAQRRLARAGPRAEPLARAVGLRRGEALRVVDATAGLGRDAGLLAWLGADVLAIERHPVVAALLQDALARAAGDARLGPALAARLHVLCADARAVLSDASRPPPDVVLLDPMYPTAGRRAAPRRELALLRQLVGADEDAAELLDLALSVARRRVVVKRPAHAPPLGGREPHHRLPGASTRFDVHVVPPRGRPA